MGEDGFGGCGGVGCPGDGTADDEHGGSGAERGGGGGNSALIAAGGPGRADARDDQQGSREFGAKASGLFWRADEAADAGGLGEAGQAQDVVGG